MASKKNKVNPTNQTKSKEFTKNQIKYLEILKKNAGRIQVSCDKAQIHRSTHYEWMKNKAFKKEIEEINESLKDLVEGKIINHIQSTNEKVSADMCKFFAKTKMKDRGYVERQELDHTIGTDNKIEVEIIEVIKKEDDEEKPEEIKKIAIAGIPKSGKTTLSKTFNCKIYHTDDLIKTHEWSEASLEVSKWFDKKESYVIEGVAVPRALRKWMAANEGKPCDKLIWLEKAHEQLSPGQFTMAKGCIKVFNEIKEELIKRGVEIDEQ